MYLIKSKVIFVALFAILLVGCGFQLRGIHKTPTDINSIAIVTQNTVSHDIDRLLRYQLQSYGIKLTNKAQADYWLILEKDDLSQQLTNIAASTVPRQYQLTYHLIYSLMNKRLSPIKTSQVVTVMRQLTINNNQILSSDFESGVIISEMHREAIIQLISRLSRQ